MDKMYFMDHMFVHTNKHIGDVAQIRINVGTLVDTLFTE